MPTEYSLFYHFAFAFVAQPNTAFARPIAKYSTTLIATVRARLRLRRGYRKRYSRTRTQKTAAISQTERRQSGAPRWQTNWALVGGHSMWTTTAHSLQLISVVLTKCPYVAGVRQSVAGSAPISPLTTATAIHCCYCAIIIYAFRLWPTFFFYLFLFAALYINVREFLQRVLSYHMDLHTHLRKRGCVTVCQRVSHIFFGEHFWKYKAANSERRNMWHEESLATIAMQIFECSHEWIKM